MSASMYWRPVVRKPDGEHVPDSLRYRLAQRIWDQDGSPPTDKDEIGPEIIPYLEGLHDGGVAGAEDLIEAIRQHGSIEIWISR